MSLNYTHISNTPPDHMYIDCAFDLLEIHNTDLLTCLSCMSRYCCTHCSRISEDGNHVAPDCQDVSIYLYWTSSPLRPRVYPPQLCRWCNRNIVVASH